MTVDGEALMSRCTSMRQTDHGYVHCHKKPGHEGAHEAMGSPDAVQFIETWHDDEMES